MLIIQKVVFQSFGMSTDPTPGASCPKTLTIILSLILKQSHKIMRDGNTINSRV